MTVNKLRRVLQRLERRGNGEREVLCWKPVGMIWMDVTKVTLSKETKAVLLDGEWFADEVCDETPTPWFDADELQEAKLPDEGD